MIVSRGRNYLFVHIPKTGGTALSLSLEARALKDDILIGDTPKAIRRRRRLQDLRTSGRLWKHATLADIDGLLTPQEIGRMFAFTLVRNPWDRVVSYYHWLREQGFDHPAVVLARSTSFDGFAGSRQTLASLQASPARRYMQDATGREHCSSYIRLERFSQDAAALEQHLGFAIDLPVTNRSDRARDFRGYYSPALKDKIARACAEDIERFGYSFD